MVATPLAAEQTWRLLWSRAAHDIIVNLPSFQSYELVPIGYGWGLRDPANHRRALLVHPTGQGREIGDLALTIPDCGTQVIPRCGWGYVEYLDQVADMVEAAARGYLSS